MNKIIWAFLLVFMIAITGIIMPQSVFAEHSISHTIEQLYEQTFVLQSYISALAEKSKDTGKPTDTGKPADTGKPSETGKPSTVPETTPPSTPTAPSLPQQSPQTSIQPSTPKLSSESTEQKPSFENAKEQIKVLEEKTRELERQVEQQKSSIQSKPSVPQTPSKASGASEVKKDLFRGVSGDDVKKLQEFLAKDKSIYPEGRITGYFGPATEAAVKKLQEKYGIETVGVVGPKTRELLAKGLQPPSAKKLVEKAVSQGASGKEVKNMQELLRRFPEIYPKGRATGFYGPATEKAIKNFQEKLGILATGSIDGKTQEKINELAMAVERKQPPKIINIVPAEISIGEKVILTGSGFTLEGNSLFVKGKTILTGLTSHDGAAVVFAVPQNIPCEIGKGCPIKIINSNGISNAKPFKLVEAGPIPSPEPLPPPPPQSPTPTSPPSPPPSPAAPTLTSISPSIVNTGMQFNLSGSGFTATNNSVTFTGAFTEPNQIIDGIASADGTTLKVTISSTMPCKLITECGVFVSNQNGKSNSISFWLGQHIDPVTVTSPNGEERIIQGTGITISATGGKRETTGTVSIAFYLVKPEASIASDPTDFIIGTIPSGVSGYVWDAQKVSTGYSSETGIIYADVAPGDYKILAVGTDILDKNTIWDTTTNIAGNIDLSDVPFTILPAPSITVVSPNGGETYKHGDKVTITWETKSIASKSVNIKLVKSGSLVQTIASNVPQSADTGLLLYSWTIPNYLTPASDYTIEVSDAVNSLIRDTSDGLFKIAANVALQIYSPNGEETVMRGFSALLFWTYSGYTPSSINVNLYKAGSFYRSLATGVAPVGFSGYDFLKASYPSSSRYAEIPIVSDIPEGNDYTLEIIDSSDSTISDKSDAPFKIITLPNPVTFKGRLVDSLSGQPVVGVSFLKWSGNSWLSAFTTGANGEFSYTADIVSMVDPSVQYLQVLFGIPQCNDATVLWLRRFPDFPRTLFGGWFTGLYPTSTVRRQNIAIINSVMELGDVATWPTADAISTFNDIRAGFMVTYMADGRVQGGTGNINKVFSNGLQNTPPLGADMYVEYSDQSGKLYLSPISKYATEPRCTHAAHSFIDGAYQWEQYPIGITIDWTGGGAIWSVGTPFKATVKTYSSAQGYSTGTAPYTWTLIGSPPTGLTVNSATGEITGIPTTTGTYFFGIKVKDANSVRATFNITITIR